MQDSRSKDHKDDFFFFFFLHLLSHLSKIQSEIPCVRGVPHHRGVNLLDGGKKRYIHKLNFTLKYQIMKYLCSDLFPVMIS